jgi:hypothetical protein
MDSGRGRRYGRKSLLDRMDAAAAVKVVDENRSYDISFGVTVHRYKTGREWVISAGRTVRI